MPEGLNIREINLTLHPKKLPPQQPGEIHNNPES
jgi:hypothetical protein